MGAECAIINKNSWRCRYAQIFVNDTEEFGKTAVIRGRDAEHIRVLRLRPGEAMTICDGRGTDYRCRLVRSDKDEAEAEILEVVPCPGEPSVKVRIFCGLPKGDKTDYIIQNASRPERRR